MTLEQVKADLRDIRYYYAKQKDLDGAARSVGTSSIKEKVERYNEAVRKAPVKLYDVYVSLYVNNNTQLVLSFDWDCSSEYVKRLNRQLCRFLQEELSKGNESQV